MGLKLPKTSEGSNSVINSLLYSNMLSLPPSLNVLGKCDVQFPTWAPKSKLHSPWFDMFLFISASYLSLGPVSAIPMESSITVQVPPPPGSPL